MTGEVLDKTQRRYLRSLAHQRKALVRIGQQGLSDAVLTEINTALDHHELLKIRIPADDREQRDALCTDRCAATGAELVQKPGTTVSRYRRKPGLAQILLPGTAK